MPWFKVDDNLAFHHKVVAAGNPALGLWVRAGSLCAQQLTDGFIPDHMIPTLGTIAQAKKLVQVGLWDRARGGYRFHGWDERQPSKASVEAERAAAQERMRLYRAKKKGTSPNTSSQVDEVRSEDVQPNERGTNGEVQGLFGNPDPTHPDPSRPDPLKGAELVVIRGEVVSDENTAQTILAEWISHCSARPPKAVIGQIAKHIKTMVEEGIESDRLRAGLAEWNRKGLHPSTLPSVVHEVANRSPHAGMGRAAEQSALLERAMVRAEARERNGA